MEQAAVEIRKLVYTVICFQCILQLTKGSPYERYLKLFSYLLTTCMCCGVIFSFAGGLEESLMSAQQIYDEWESGWEGLTGLEQIEESSGYYTDKIWNGKIVGDAKEQYEREQEALEHEEGGGEDAGLVEE